MEYPEAPAAKDMQEKNIERETWLVESLDDHRKVARGKLEFLVRWAGPYERTWEPRANIPEELISRYFAKLRKKVDAKRKKASNLVVDNNWQIDLSNMSECSDKSLVDSGPPPRKITFDTGDTKPSPEPFVIHIPRALPRPEDQPFIIQIPRALPRREEQPFVIRIPRVVPPPWHR